MPHYTKRPGVVLWIDGDAGYLSEAAPRLERATGTAVHTVADEAAALSVVRDADAAASVVCVLCDHDPPTTDALSVRRTLRAAVDVPFVVVTARGSEAFAGEAVAAGVAGYVPKGDAEMLGSRVDALLSRSHDAFDFVTAEFVDALDVLDDVFYVYDADGRLVQWNDRLGEVFELSDDELRGMRPTEFFLAEDHAAVEAAVVEALETGGAVVEARAPTPDGGVIRFQLTGRRLTDSTGAVAGLCGIGRDVTEQRSHERQLARQNELLEEFASVVSHDLRNPLAVATGYLDLAAETGDPAALERVESALERMARIIDDVLTAARNGQSVTATRTVSLADVAAAAWANVETDGATLVVTTDAAVDVDPERLQRVFENLFRNSVEHGSASDRAPPDDGATPDARPPDDAGVTVTVTATPEGFAVTDDGPGFSGDTLDCAFEAGFTTSADGTGLGLTIVRQLAEAHGWRVGVGNAPDGGARFEFAGAKLAPTSDASLGT